MITIFKAGTYFIGDPCYLFNRDNWINYLDSGGMDGGVFTYEGKQVFCESTAYGDGSYEDQYGNSYCVDAGIIGVTPIEFNDFKYDDLSRLGLIFEANEPFDVDYKHGVFEIANIEINTLDVEDY